MDCVNSAGYHSTDNEENSGKYNMKEINFHNLRFFQLSQANNITPAFVNYKIKI